MEKNGKKSIQHQRKNSLPIYQKLTQWIVSYSLRQMQYRYNFSIEKEEVYEIHNNNKKSLLYSQK